MQASTATVVVGKGLLRVQIGHVKAGLINSSIQKALATIFQRSHQALVKFFV